MRCLLGMLIKLSGEKKDCLRSPELSTRALKNLASKAGGKLNVVKCKNSHACSDQVKNVLLGIDPHSAKY